MARTKREHQEHYAYEPDFAVPPGRTLQETIDALEMDQRVDQMLSFTGRE